MLVTREEQFTRLIAPVCFFLQLSAKAYSKYVSNRIFLHARNIRSANEKICQLLNEYPAYLPEALIHDAMELLNHYGIWMAQFDECRNENNPRLGDPFVFHQLDDQSAFPRSASQHFIEYYEKMKAELVPY